MSRMKYGTKPQQGPYFREILYPFKWIKVFYIDVEKKTIIEIEIKNFIEYIQDMQLFLNYKYLILNAELDCIIYGIDDDLKKDNSFIIKGLNITFYGNAVITKLPKNQAMCSFKKTSLTHEYLSRLIEFNK